MSKSLVERIKELMEEKMLVIKDLQSITEAVTISKEKLQELHNIYSDKKAHIEELDNKVNQLIMKINLNNTRSLQQVLSYREVYNADSFGERISDISKKVLYEYNTIMNLDKKMSKQLTEINKSYENLLKTAD